MAELTYYFIKGIPWLVFFILVGMIWLDFHHMIKERKEDEDNNNKHQ